MTTPACARAWRACCAAPATPCSSPRAARKGSTSRAATRSTSSCRTCGCRASRASTCCSKLRDVNVDACFIVMTGFGTVDTAVEAMKLGAVDFVQKPFFRDELLMRVRAAADRRQLARQVTLLQRQLPASTPPEGLVGRSDAMAKVQGRDPPRRRRAGHRAHHGRDRHRQGARRARDSRRQPAGGEAVRRAELRRADRVAARERALRPRARRVHRRGRRPGPG